MKEQQQTDSFRQRVFHILAAIPPGRLMTYGLVATLAGSPRAARQVGGILKRLPEGSLLPWHRVVNRQGRISLQGEDFKRQQSALRAEGVLIDPSGCIELSNYLWRGE